MHIYIVGDPVFINYTNRSCEAETLTRERDTARGDEGGGRNGQAIRETQSEKKNES